MLAKQFAASAVRRTYGATVCLTVVCVMMFGAVEARATDADIVNAMGFELPHFTTTFNGTGQLEGQVNPIGFGQVISPGQWLAVQGTTGTAIVVPNPDVPGTQAVKVDRAANSFDRWAVPVNNQGYPDYPNPAPPEPAQPCLCISWDMRVEAAAGDPDNGVFGPFFGVEAYDDDSVAAGLLGSLGVDATTGDVLYQDAGTGFITETGSVVGFGAWNNFQIKLDYSTKTYDIWLNGAVLGSIGFVDEGKVPGGLTRFTDANISALAAAGDAASLALTGTAYYDNFLVREGACIPEPGTLALTVLGLLAIVGIGRGRQR